MSQAGTPEPLRGPDESEEAVLQAKYLDYCSARMAEVLLRLSADEMYVLAVEVARESGMAETAELSYERIVRLATERLSRELGLPPFETWVVAYREDPARFESELLGLWKDGFPVAGSSRNSVNDHSGD